MAGELVERLRNPWDGTAGARARRDAERAEAADRIEALERENATLREAGNLDGLLDLWDTLDTRINRMLTSQPAEMSASAARLEEARVSFGDAVRKYTLAIASAIRNMGGEG